MYPNQQVTQLRKAGQLEEAYRLGAQALQQTPNDTWLQGAVAWVHYEYIKLAVEGMERAQASDRPLASQDVEQVHRFLQEYARLHLPRPDMAYSQIIRLLAKVGAQLPYYVPFLVWGGLAAFSEEDHEPFAVEKGAVPCLLTRTAREAMAWCVSHPEKLTEHAAFVLQLAENALNNPREDQGNRIWLYYDRADLHHKLGNIDAADADMRKTLRTKQRELWAWGRMGDIYSEQDPDLAIASYCQGLSLNPPPQFAVKVRLNLARLLQQQGEQEAAIAEYLAVAEVYQREGWSFPEKLDAALQADWFDPSRALQDSLAFYKQRAPQAQGLLYEEVRNSPATYLRSLKQERNGKVRWSIVAAVSEGASGPPRQHLLKWPCRGEPTLEPGDPLGVTTGSLDGREQVLALDTREGGQAWDCLDDRAGVVSSLNKDGTRGGIYLGGGTEAVLVNDSPATAGPLALGDAVQVKLCVNPSKDQRLEAYAPRKLEQVPSLEGVEPREGELSLHEQGFGFIDSEVFVAPHLLDKSWDGRRVVALSIWKKKPKKEEFGWTALTLELAVDGE